MKGRVAILYPTGARIVSHLSSIPSPEVFQRMVGGPLEQIPGFLEYEKERCVAFCDELGKIKGLQYNETADHLWQSQFPNGDHLVGPVVIVTGDTAFMRAL